jgi:poly-gamma-glutamate capsule biosynthesis protein CapA/YwtB (metallophosphatase superfamily)
MIRIGVFVFFLVIVIIEGDVIIDKKSLRCESVSNSEENTVRLFLCGDVMSGRGIDQILIHPGDPEIHESYMKNAEGYVILAEKENGKISHPVGMSYIWGSALKYWKELAPDIRIINLETSITNHDICWPGKAVNYRMNPENIGCLTRAGIDCAALANNHLLDYDRPGMLQTIQVLQDAGICFSGAGENLDKARNPAILTIPGKGRVLFFSLGRPSSGIPLDWAANQKEGGVYLPSSDGEILDYLKSYLILKRQDQDIVIVSIHWGSNWGYEIPAGHRRLAHRLIDEAGVNVIHGHSSHHFKGIEDYKGRPIFYGAGDFINDYEGIGGHETFHGDLTLMYFVDLECMNGTMKGMTLIPLKIRKMRLENAGREECSWVLSVLNREGRSLNTEFERVDQSRIVLINK